MNLSTKLANIRKYYQFEVKGLFKSICIEAFSLCNRNCRFCPNNDQYPKRQKGKMPFSIWKTIIDQLSETNYSGRISPHLYGEPLMDKRIFELITYAKDKCPDSEFVVMSNGDFLNESTLEKLIESGMDSILITNYDGFEKNELKELENKYSQYVTVRNFSDIVKKNKAGILNNVDKPKENTNPCLRPVTQMVVNWEGNVILCCNDYYGKHIIGHVNDEPLLRLWFSRRMKKYQKILSKNGGRYHVDICKECDN